MFWKGYKIDFIDYDLYRNGYGIYKIENIKNGKIYIGQTKQPFKKRYWIHCWKLKHGTHDNLHLQSSYNEYGDGSFSFSIVRQCEDGDDLDKLEMQYIRYYNSYNQGYNLTIGGDGKRGCPMSEHAKKIVGEKNRVHMTGRHLPESTKEKMRLSSTHHKCSDSHKAAVSEYMKNRVVSDSTKAKLSAAFSGSKSGFAKIDESVARKIMQMLMDGISPTEISKSLSVGYQTVTAIRNRKTWRASWVDGFDEWSAQYKSKEHTRK